MLDVEKELKKEYQDLMAYYKKHGNFGKSIKSITPGQAKNFAIKTAIKLVRVKVHMESLEKTKN